jgi:hypothetical protein
MNWNGFGKKRSWPNFKVLSPHLPEGTVGKPWKVCQDSQSLGRDMNPRPPRCKEGVLTTWPRCSGSLFFIAWVTQKTLVSASPPICYCLSYTQGSGQYRYLLLLGLHPQILLRDSVRMHDRPRVQDMIKSLIDGGREKLQVGRLHQVLVGLWGCSELCFISRPSTHETTTQIHHRS